MSGLLKTAFCLWLSSKLSGVVVVGDRLANRNDRGESSYPEILVTEISFDDAPVGLPRATDKVRDGQGRVTHRGKLYTENIHYRLTISCTDSRSTGIPGLTSAELLRRRIIDLVRTSQIGHTYTTMTDTEASPSETFIVRKIELAGTQEVPAETYKEPIIYRTAVTLKLWRVVRHERQVEHVFTDIAVTEDTDEQE